MDQTSKYRPCLGFLSGAPRVSTRPDAQQGGPRAHVLGIINAFENLGWQVLPFIVGDHTPKNWITSGSEETIVQGDFHALLADLIRLIIGFLSANVAYYKIRNKIDWVYERFAAFQILGNKFKRHGVLWILETNALYFYEAKGLRRTSYLINIGRIIELKAYRDCDILVCISEVLKNRIVNEGKIAPEKILVMPNGVDTNFFNPALYQPIRKSDGFCIGYVGMLTKWQGLDLLLESIYELIIEGLEINLVIVGDGPEERPLVEKVKLLNLSRHVNFTGRLPRNKVPAYILGFDVGFSGQSPQDDHEMYLSPMKVYEYMAMSKPVIAANYTDAKNIVIENETGWTFKIDNKVSLMNNLRNAYECRHDLPAMGKNARENIKANHSWDIRISTLIEEVEKNFLTM